MEQYNMYYCTTTNKLYTQLDKALSDIEVTLTDSQKEDYSVLIENNIYYYKIPTKLEYDADTEYLVNKGKTKVIDEDGLEVYTDTLEVAPIEVDEDTKANQAKYSRKRRDNLLSQTDWVVTKSLELGNPIPDDWKDYRQALRDISQQSGFPENVEWPTLSFIDQNNANKILTMDLQDCPST